MDALALTLVLGAIFCWCVLAGPLGRAGITAPIMFVAVGFVLDRGAAVLDLASQTHLVKVLAEVTLVWVLFADASRVGPGQVRRDLGRYVRLLGVGLPLTVALGTAAAVLVLDLDPWAALLVGAALAPTDAALGTAVMADPRVPSRIRAVLNVESGLNDGVATPIVLVAIAGVAAHEGIPGVESPGRAVLGLVVGLAAGGVAGGLGGLVTRLAARRGWLSAELAGPAVLALALLAYTGALLVEGNGFVAAFVGGLTFGATGGRNEAREVAFVDQSGALASMVCWLVFGALAVPAIGDSFGWAALAYAVLSLTLVRMVPVGVALAGTGLDRRSVLFIGWFGPRGLASVIFALLALEDLHSAAQEVVAAVALTVLLSVVAHGLSARPLAGRVSRGLSTPRPRSAR